MVVRVAVRATRYAADSAGPCSPAGLPFSNVTEIHELSVTELAAAIRAAELSPVEITDHYLSRIDRLNEQVGAFYTVTAELAREAAGQAAKAVTDSLRGPGTAALPPLLGIPVPIKDLNMVAGVRMTFGSAVFAIVNNPPETDTTGPGSLMIVDARNNKTPVLYPFRTQFGLSGIAVANGFLLVPDQNGLNIYQISIP